MVDSMMALRSASRNEVGPRGSKVPRGSVCPRRLACSLFKGLVALALGVLVILAIRIALEREEAVLRAQVQAARQWSHE